MNTLPMPQLLNRSLTQSKRRHIVIDSLPGALWRMIGLVHDPHVRILLLQVGILTRKVGR